MAKTDNAYLFAARVERVEMDSEGTKVTFSDGNSTFVMPTDSLSSDSLEALQDALTSREYVSLGILGSSD